jgi:hypothetical protein
LTDSGKDIAATSKTNRHNNSQQWLFSSVLVGFDAKGKFANKDRVIKQAEKKEILPSNESRSQWLTTSWT